LTGAVGTTVNGSGMAQTFTGITGAVTMPSAPATTRSRSLRRSSPRPGRQGRRRHRHHRVHDRLGDRRREARLRCGREHDNIIANSSITGVLDIRGKDASDVLVIDGMSGSAAVSSSARRR